VTFNYRGSWGSPGQYRFSQNPEDADAVLAFLRDPAHAGPLGIDTMRIAMAGHSMGGWVVALTAPHDHALIGAVLISAGDMGRLGDLARNTAVAEMADNMEALAGVTPESMADEVIANSKSFRMTKAAEDLVNMPLLALTADDGLAPHTDALVQAIREGGGKKVIERHVATDHSWSDHRIALATIVLTWLAGLQPAKSGNGRSIFARRRAAASSNRRHRAQIWARTGHLARQYLQSCPPITIGLKDAPRNREYKCSRRG
jgi:uncharacterized protein